MAKITLKNLAHSYVDNPQSDTDYAIKSLDHTLEQGGAYALLGPSGCGKSTLLNIISGLLIPSQGEIYFDEQCVTHVPTEQRNIAQVFQFPVVYDALTVFQNLAFPLKNTGVAKTQIEQKVNQVSALLELDSILHKKARNLTADQKQKVSMARGLVRENVSAILFDEPLTVIDPHLKWKLRRKLKQIHEQLNITMLYVTHDQLEAATFADQIALMYEGKIVQFGTPQDLFERPNHTFVGYFIGSPGMNFIPVERVSNGVAYKGYIFALTQLQQEALNTSSSSNLKLGIRPEFIHLSKGNKENTHSLPLLTAENLGSYQLMSFGMEQLAIVVRTSEPLITSNETHALHFPSQWLKLYIDEYLVGEAETKVHND